MPIDRQNVTLSLPRNVVLKARHIAVERGVSLSALLAAHLKEIVRHEPEYEAAKEAALEMMARGLPMGVDQPDWSREELHER